MSERNNLGQFVKGNKPTPEERLKMNRSLMAAAKLRPDYIGDIKEKYPRAFSSWRAILYTEKGKKAGVVERWRSFRSFIEDVSEQYKPGLVLRRKDTDCPWGPDNFVCVTAQEAGQMRTSVIRIEYNGDVHSLREWSELYTLPLNPMMIRYHRRNKRGYTNEEIIFGRKKRRGTKEAKDKDSEGVNIRAKASKMISSYRANDRTCNMELCDITIEWMIENILSKPCVYCGDTKRIGCDRIDNNRGHTRDNVVPCCIECNTARNNYFTYEEMRELGRTIAEIKARRNHD